jgi:hypothetical protein
MVTIELVNDFRSIRSSVHTHDRDHRYYDHHEYIPWVIVARHQWVNIYGDIFNCATRMRWSLQQCYDNSISSWQQYAHDPTRHRYQTNINDMIYNMKRGFCPCRGSDRDQYQRHSLTNEDNSGPGPLPSTPIYVLAQQWSSATGHILTEVLPRVMPFLDQLRHNTDIHIFCGDICTPLLKELLEFLGITRDRLFAITQSSNEHILVR